MENTCSGILLAESRGLGELLRASSTSLIAYGHRLAVIHSFHLVAEYISSIRVRFCRFPIFFSATPLVECVFTPTNASFCLRFLCLLPVVCFKYTLVGVIRFYDDNPYSDCIAEKLL